MSLPAGSTIGILGGGQLGRMLAMAAARLGYRVIVLDPDPSAPAAQVANDHIVAAFDDPGALHELSERCDVITYEFENVPVLALDSLDREGLLKPGTRALEVAQDRLVEKEFFAGLGLGTAPYRQVDSADDLCRAVEELDSRVILKTRRLGYDGKGQVRINNPLTHEEAEQVLSDLGDAPSIAEGFVDFRAEISVIAARGSDGSTACFPPAANDHDSGILARSVVPCDEPDDVVSRATAAATALLGALDYVGVLGLELFVTAGGHLLVNEFAPRVHNSGHWTELASVVDQFEQHIRAITGHPLGTVETIPCEMINLIGDDVDQVPDLLADGSWRVHLYGKAEVRPGRKMGHATRLLG